MNYKDILKQSIDLHVHVRPEIIPRRFTIPELAQYEKGKLKGIGVKNHFFPTISMMKSSEQSQEPFVIGSVVLNHYVGGFNADVIRASADLSKRSIIVWFPTLHSKKFLEGQEFEIPKEWLSSGAQKKLKLRRTRDIQPLTIFEQDKKIRKDVLEVLKTIKECHAILATGHLSWEESYELVRVARKDFGITKIIITHPIYQKIAMPIEIQKELARLGAVMEQSYSMYSIDKIRMKEIALEIKEVGAENCILSSDVGQTFSKSPSEALSDFMLLLEKEGVTKEEMTAMLVKNPERLAWKD
jgi:hypothetical protein